MPPIKGKVQMYPVFRWDQKLAVFLPLSIALLVDLPTYLLTFTTLEQSSPCTVSKVGLTKLSFKKKFDCFHMALAVQPVTLPGQLLSSPLDHALSYVLKNLVTLDLSTFTSCCSYNRWWVMLSDSEHPTSLQAVPQLGGKSAHLECVRPWLKFTEQKVPI